VKKASNPRYTLFGSERRKGIENCDIFKVGKRFQRRMPSPVIHTRTRKSK
jgi:hypothetical protein